MLTRFLDEISGDTTSTFRADPMDTMNHDNNHDDRANNNGLTSLSQSPMFTADQLQAMYRQSQQRNNISIPNQPSVAVQQQYPSINNTTNQNWMQLLQPTPLGTTLQNQQNASNPQASNNREMKLMLQQLFPDQRNTDNSTSNQSQAPSLFTLGSTVEPMHHRNAPDSESEPDFFKGMWDVEEATLPGMGKPPPFQSSKTQAKRKWMQNYDEMNSAKGMAPQKGQFQNQATSHNFATSSLQGHQPFSFQMDAMDDSEDISFQYNIRNIRTDSPMSTSSGVGVPPNHELLPASCMSSSHTIASASQHAKSDQQQQISHMEDLNTVSISEEDYASLLPSTLLPPSVMASVLHPGLLTSSGHNGPSNSGGGRYKKKKGTKSTRVESPVDALQRILSLQGYGPIQRIPAEDAQYETIPSQLQLASFGTELVKAIHTSDTQHLSKLLEMGLSPNPCNKFRDSMVDLVCKRANGEIFKCLVDHGCDLRVCDGFGRTPLHHCCWASEFSATIAETILEIDWLQLFIEDKRGQIPLEYVRPDQAAEWVEFLEDNRQRFFPIGGRPSTLLAVKDYRPDNVLPDPRNALPVELASAISSGRLTTDELENMDHITRSKFR